MSDIPGPTHSLQEARFRQRRIGKALGQVYAGLTNEGAPEDFLDLLALADLAQAQRQQPLFPSTTQLSRPSSSP
jgi:hypothetical protein